MTVTSASSPTQGRRYRFSPLRVLFCSILLSLLVVASLYLKYSAVDFFHARLLDQGSKTSAWILKQVSYALPWIFMCIFHAITYRRHDRHDGVAAREMFWEVVLVTIFTYLMLLPYLRGISDEMYAAALEAGATIPQTAGKVDQTFIMIFHEWFVRLSIPLLGLMVFYSTRARRQRLHPETEADEPLMTRAEYDALISPVSTADDDDETAEKIIDSENQTKQADTE